MTTQGSDPYFYFRTSTGRGIDADVYRTFRCRIRLSGGAGNASAQFFWFRAGQPFATAFAIPIDSAWHLIELDLAAEAEWQGTVARIRLDPGTAAGLTVELDEAELLPDLAPPPPDTQVEADKWSAY